MKHRYAITDIHGNYKTFLSALEGIELKPEDELYLLGDYVDRGPGSRQVIEHILQLKAEGYQLHCLRGNHEQYMLNAFTADNKEYMRFWLRAGGRQTVESYEELGEKHASVLLEHLEWMQGLPYYMETDGYILVHAGLNFDVEDPFKDLESLIQIRRWKESVDREWLGDRTVVHGHTPMSKWQIKQQLDPVEHPYPVLDIDGGCFYYKEGYGHLCVLDLDSREMQFFPNLDMPLDEIRAERARDDAKFILR